MTKLLLVHGGCHGAWCFDPLLPVIEQRGVRAVAVALPYEDPRTGLSELGRQLSSAIEDQDDQVAVVAHSMGGMVAPLVGEHPRVSSLILLCAALPSKLVGLDIPYSTVPPDALVTDEEGCSRFRSPEVLREFLYHDCSEEVVAWAWKRLTPMAYRIAMDDYPLEAWPAVPTTSIICQGDRAVSSAFSHAAAANIGAPVLQMEGSHSPFASRPAELADLLVEIVEGL